jgi:hypothetical protein
MSQNAKFVRLLLVGATAHIRCCTAQGVLNLPVTFARGAVNRSLLPAPFQSSLRQSRQCEPRRDTTTANRRALRRCPSRRRQAWEVVHAKKLLA